MNAILRMVASALPETAQTVLKKHHFRSQIRAGTFRTNEPEYALLSQWIRPRDCVIDVGANIGHYTIEMARLGARVMAFEPLAVTFELLMHNCAISGCREDVALFNVALSSKTGMSRMSVPRFGTGLLNYYGATIHPSGRSEVMAVALDDVMPEQRISLIKVDVERHEYEALRGMEKLLRRDKPRLIVEGIAAGEAGRFLLSLGYSSQYIPNSPNTIFS